MNTEQDNQIIVEETNNSSITKPKQFNLQWLINIILIIGLLTCVLLLVLKPNNDVKSTNLKIGFINSDTLMSNYLFFNEKTTELEIEAQKMQSQLMEKDKLIQNQIADYQKRIQAGTISQIDASKTEDRIREQQQQLMQMNEEFSNQLASKESELTLGVLDSVNLVIEQINKTESFDYVLGYTRGAVILYANPKHDITQKVLEKLNKNFKANKNP